VRRSTRQGITFLLVFGRFFAFAASVANQTDPSKPLMIGNDGVRVLNDAIPVLLEKASRPLVFSSTRIGMPLFTSLSIFLVAYTMVQKNPTRVIPPTSGFLDRTVKCSGL